MNEEQQRIWDYLNHNALGYNNRRTSSEIRNRCDLESGGVTNEHVRDLIRDMIFNHNCSIGSVMWGSGYWIIQNETELNRVVQSLRNRADSINERADRLIRNFNNRQNG
jgi:hypothetical protein